MKSLLLTVIVLLGYGAGAYAVTDSPAMADNNTEHGLTCTSGDLVQRTDLRFTLKLHVRKVQAKKDIYGDNYGKYLVLPFYRYGRVGVKLDRRRSFELHTLRLILENVKRITVKRHIRDPRGRHSVSESYNTSGKHDLELKWNDHKILKKIAVVAETEGNDTSIIFVAFEACTLDTCAPEPCQNGGECTAQADDYTCACQSGYTGKDCEDELGLCGPGPCQNGGECTAQADDYTCACENGYTGKDCEYSPP